MSQNVSEMYVDLLTGSCRQAQAMLCRSFFSSTKQNGLLHITSLYVVQVSEPH